MGYQSAYIPSPYNGISQAAPQVRLQEQAEDLRDCVVDLPDGWRKRPPFQFQAKLLEDVGLSSARCHKIKDPDNGLPRFFVLNREGSTTVARLWDQSWGAISLTIESGAQDYLDDITSPKADSRISQIVDYTVITNKTKVVAVDSSLVATRPHEALVFIKAGAFGKKYQLTVTKSGGTPRVGYVVTPNGNDAEDSLWVDTDKIAQGIAGTGYTYAGTNSAAVNNIAANLATDSFTVTIQAGVIYLSNVTDFTVTVQDAQGGVAMSAAKDTVNNFSDLPKSGVVDGFTVKVLPTRGDKNGAYWVKFNLTPSPGSWVETVGPGSEKGIDVSTMPVGVIKEADGTWHIKVLDWKQRTVGDEDLCIDPLFVGSTIQDVGYCFGRLLLVSKEEAFLTAADDPFRIYPATMTAAIDSDPISMIPPTGEASFVSATTFEKATVVTGLQQQCIIRSLADGPVSASNLKMTRMTGYLLNDLTQILRPPGNNNKIYLPVPLGGSYIGIRELKIDRISGEDIGDDLTAALPKKLPIAMDIVSSCETNFTALYALSTTNQLYLHVFRYNENQRVQNGFFPWFLPTGWTIVDIVTEGTQYLLFVLMAGDLYSMSVEMNPQETDFASPFFTRLDFRQSNDRIAGAAYNATTNQTTFTSNYPIGAGLGYVVAQESDGSAPYPAGYLAEVISQPTPLTIVVKGNWTGVQHYWVGIGYTGYWKLSQIFKLSPQDTRVIHSGELTLKRMVFDLVNTGGITVRVTVGGRSVRNYDLPNTALGQEIVYTGPFTIPLKGNAKKTTIEVFDNGPLGSTVTGGEWFGDFTARSFRTS